MKYIIILFVGVALAATILIWRLRPKEDPTAWLNFQHVVFKTYPAAKKQFAEGAAPQDIERLRQLVPHELPDAFVDMLSKTNGGTGKYNSNGIFFGAELLSVEGIIRELNNWKQIVDGGLEDFTDDYTSYPAGTVRPVYVDQNWLPFAGDGAGNFLALDFNPGVNGTVGQVISFGADEIELLQISESFSAFLELMTELVGHPDVTYDPDSGTFEFEYYIVDKLRSHLKALHSADDKSAIK